MPKRNQNSEEKLTELKKLSLTALFIGLLSLLSACAVNYNSVALDKQGNTILEQPGKSEDINKKIAQLTNALLTLSPAISKQEAQQVAKDAYLYPLHLADKWNITWPPLYHNALRNTQFRQKGLCTDWADAMLNRMRSKNLTTLDLYWAVANPNSYFTEHSSLLITAKGMPFNTGIILDPWRNSGKLFWSRVDEDKRYAWNYYSGPHTSPTDRAIINSE